MTCSSEHGRHATEQNPSHSASQTKQHSHNHSKTARKQNQKLTANWPAMHLPEHTCTDNTQPINKASGPSIDGGIKAHSIHRPVYRPFDQDYPGEMVPEDKTNLDFTEARDREWQWHQLGQMQVCTSLKTDNHASTPPLSFLQAR